MQSVAARARRTVACSSRQEPLLRTPAGATRAEVKAAFRSLLLRLHPDVNKGAGDAEAQTRLLLTEYRQALRRSSEPPRDAFASPECEATLLFVHELRCLGRSCWSSCVSKAPSTFSWSERTGAARAACDSRDDEYAVRCAVGQCPSNCIHLVTPLQLERLQAELERARSGEASADEVGLELDVLLARSDFENGRYTPSDRRRTPVASGEYVDFY